jgi:hypothetical protein
MMIRGFGLSVLLLTWVWSQDPASADASGLRSVRRRDLREGRGGDEEPQEGGFGWGGPWLGGDEGDHDPEDFFDQGDWNETPPMDGSWFGGNETFGDALEDFRNFTEDWMDGEFPGANWTDEGDWWDHEDGRPSHDGGHGLFPMGGPPAAGALGAFIASWTSSIEYGGLKCPLSGANTSDEPACAANLNGDLGVWVCRNLANPFTGESQSLSVCADSNQTIETVDECGCCGGSCPQVCECQCTTPFGDDGVRVAMNGTVMGEEAAFEVCMDSKFAVGIVGTSGSVISCVTNCSAALETPPPFMMMPGGRA